METATPNPLPSSHHPSLKVDLRWLIVVLLAAIAAMLIIWKPWSKAAISDRTVQVTGQATIKAEPDEFIFYPTYNFSNTDKAAALAALTKKNNAIVAKLKTLGVTDQQIKTSASDNNYPTYIYSPIHGGTNTYSLSLTVTVDNQKLAQKVEDYLVTTAPGGTLTPQAQFSEAKRKQLEGQARDDATKDARSKVDQEAKNLGFKVGKVKSVEDGQGFGTIPLQGGSITGTPKALSSDNSTQLTIQPGQNDLSYTVTVTYFIH